MFTFIIYFLLILHSDFGFLRKSINRKNAKRQQKRLEIPDLGNYLWKLNSYLIIFHCWEVNSLFRISQLSISGFASRIGSDHNLRVILWLCDGLTLSSKNFFLGSEFGFNLRINNNNKFYLSVCQRL